jgi:uncharacterized protein with von Willebrand factor type A (vWA) domain
MSDLISISNTKMFIIGKIYFSLNLFFNYGNNLKKGTNINNFKTLNSYLKNKQISSINNQITEKFQAIENVFNELKIKINENWFNKFSELFFSSKELQNISIIKLITDGKYNLNRNENWTKVII